ncbi:diguanylate cyclase [Cetobacterium sp. ZWU0022]|uniref:diguanylate cyclase n=1 Tax=Cetobacterium sp. ZWU0022 TaxID=1340502 RepID=UPI000645CEC6|nr:diguanylate cyclase [Cetobacterium sp. ZWU0022]
MFKKILDEHKNGVMVLNKKFEVCYTNKILQKIFNHTPGKRCGEFFECIHQNLEKKRCLETQKCEKCNIKNNIKKVLDGEIKNIYIENIEYEALINDKIEKISMSIEIKNLQHENENYITIEFFKLKTLDEVLISNKRLLDEMLDNLGDFIFYKDFSGQYIYGNKSFCEYIGVKKIDLIGKTDSELFSKVLVREWEKGDKKAWKEGKFTLEEKINGRYFRVTKQRLDTEEQAILVCVIRDITYERKEMKKAYQDSLTGVGNRHAYDKKIRGVFEDKEKKYSIALLDLDFLREINNQQGHNQGDFALKVAAKAIKNSGLKYIYRIGGDEFAFLIEDGVDAFEVCQSINREIKSVKIGDIPLSSSIGVINLKYDEGIINNFNCADEALYESKRSGRGKITIKKR